MADNAENASLPPPVDVESAEMKPETIDAATETKIEVPDDIEEQTPEQQRALLSKLTTAASLDYSRKKYEDAAEKYSHATELQASLDGEMNPQNAELLWFYGRCLFKVAIAKSNVLGGGVAGEDAGKKKKSKKNALPVPGDDTASKATEEKKSKGLLMIDDGMDDDDEDEDEDNEEEEDEDEDDLAVAYEILDLARVLFQKQLDAELESTSESGPEAAAAAQRRIKERLADVRDLQSEISLENERFDDAVEDSKATLGLLQQLHSEESELIAEAHYKLALAYEFSFNTSLRDNQEDSAVAAASNGFGNGAQSSSAPTDPSTKPDPTKLWYAVEHMTSAIQSCEARIAIEEKALPDRSAEEKAKKEKDIAEVKDIVVDMVPRLSELMNSAKAFSAQYKFPVPDNEKVRAAIAMLAKAADSLPSAADAQTAAKELDEAAGIKENSALATIAGESKTERQVRIQEAAANANDLSGLVRKKKPAPAATTDGGSKRKMDDEGEESEGKKMRVE